MTINVNSQSAGVINNVEGTQTVQVQHGLLAPPPHRLQVVDALRSGVAQATLDLATKREAERQVDDIDEQLRKTRPNKRTVAKRLKKVTEILVAAGAVATGGTALVQAIGSLASWLGTLGDGILGLLQSAGQGRGR